jgi:lysophospholipase L1-like esterase
MPSQEKGFLLKAIIITCIALLGSLLALEGGLRLLADTGKFDRQLFIFGKERPPLDAKTGGGMYYAHHYSAYALKPGYTNGTRERINSLGFRGEDISLAKPEGVYRIIAAGGSTTFGVYLPWNETYPYYLQEVLRARFGTDAIEVVNAGLTGSTAAESFHRLPTQLLPTDPDMVVVYHAFNDLLPRVFNDYEDDYFHFRRSDPNNPPGFTRSYLYRLTLRVLSPAYFHENYNLSNLVWKTQNLPETDTELAQNFLSSNNDAFRFNMDNIIALLKAKDIEVVLATFAMHPDIWHWQDIIPPYMWEIGIRENNEAILELASEYQLPLVPFAEVPVIQGVKAYNAPMYADSIHMSPKGNRFKAEIFADTIAPLIAAKLNVPVPPASKFAVPAATTNVLESPL